MANPPEIQKNLKYHGFFCGKIIVKTGLPSSSQTWRAGIIKLLYYQPQLINHH